MSALCYECGRKLEEESIYECQCKLCYACEEVKSKKTLRGYLLGDKRNFISEDKYYMVYCPNCEKENHSMWVAGSQCAWCGFIVEDEMVEKIKNE